jgi:hypothetical protein
MSQVYQNIQRIENAESKNYNYLNDIKKSLETIRERQRKQSLNSSLMMLQNERERYKSLVKNRPSH